MKQLITIILLCLTLTSSFAYQQAFAAIPSAVDVFDIDGDGEVKPLTDGLLVIRYLFDFRGEPLINNVIDKGATRITAPQIEAYIHNHLNELDIDGNSKAEPLSDGLLLLRYLYDFRGDVLINGVIGNAAKRLTAKNIEAYIKQKLIVPDNIWNVPFMRQHDYEFIDEAAGAATSLAMILQFYYPDSLIDPRVIFHSGIQKYFYVYGPASSYRNIRGKINNGALLLDHVSPSGRPFYFQSATGATRDHIDTYLKHSWEIKTQTISAVNGVYDAIKKGPLLIHVDGQISSGVYKDNHYVILIGIDDNNTLADKVDDILIVHDPYNNQGESLHISFTDFFSKWFINGVKFDFSDTAFQRSHTVLVDTGHNSISGVSIDHKFELENFSSWNFSYLNGDWYYHTSKSNFLSATWMPKLQHSGYYRITTTIRGEDRANSIAYVLYDQNGIEKDRAVVNHRDRDRRWLTNVIFNNIYIEDGFFVKAIDIPHSTNIDAIKFQYLGN